MATPGYPIKVYAKSSNSAPGAGDEVDGLNDATYDELADLLETTDFKSGSASAWKTRITGLNDGSIDLAGDYEAADAPQILLKTSKRSGASVWITIHFAPSASSGQKGFQVECKVEKFTVKDGVGGKTEFSASLKFTAAPVDV
jgi:hypothetical protein